MNKFTITGALALVGTAVCANAAITYSSGFEAPQYDPVGQVADNGPMLPGDPPNFGGPTPADGWSIDSPVPAISFLNPLSGSQAGAIGGSVDTPGPGGTEVNLTHPVSFPLSKLSFDADFAVVGSTGFAPGVDNFGWTFLGSSNPAAPVLRIAFEGPLGPMNSNLEIVWYDQSNTRQTTGLGLMYEADTHLNVTFTPNGADADFTATLSSSNSVMFSGTVTGGASDFLVSFGADFDVDPGAPDAGDNFMMFDNLVVVPEPSSALLLVLGLLPFARRRR